MVPLGAMVVVEDDTPLWVFAFAAVLTVAVFVCCRWLVKRI